MENNKQSALTLSENKPRRKPTSTSGRQLVEVFPTDINSVSHLPFALLDESGMLLVPAATKIHSGQLAKLTERGIFADFKEHSAHMAKMASAVGILFEKNVRLFQWKDHDIFKTQNTEVASDQIEKLLSSPDPFEIIDTIRMQLSPVLKPEDSGIGYDRWIPKIDNIQFLLTKMLEHYEEAALFFLIQDCSKIEQEYSVNHSLLCAVVCDLVAKELKLDSLTRQRLMFAALTMNISMTVLQNNLATQKCDLQPQQKKYIKIHAEESAEILAGLGIEDLELLELVRNHHQRPEEGSTEKMSSEEKAQLILHIVDILTAKISPRATRTSITSALAIKEAYQTANSYEKDVGMAIFKVLGLYPPGTYVKLVNNEVCVVVKKGLKYNEPIVATIVNKDGYVATDYKPRNTAQSTFAIQEPINPQLIKTLVNKDKISFIYKKNN